MTWDGLYVRAFSSYAEISGTGVVIVTVVVRTTGSAVLSYFNKLTGSVIRSVAETQGASISV